MIDWRHRAACLGLDPEIWFPVSNTGPGARQADRAKAVCARCPVRAECLAFALAEGLDHGVFGGLDEDERRALRARSRPVRTAV